MRKRKLVRREFKDYGKGTVVNGKNKNLDQKFLTQIQMTSRKSESELQEICESSKSGSQLLSVYSYVCFSEETAYVFHHILKRP